MSGTSLGLFFSRSMDIKRSISASWFSSLIIALPPPLILLPILLYRGVLDARDH